MKIEIGKTRPGFNNRGFNTTVGDLTIRGVINAPKGNNKTNKDSDGWEIDLEVIKPGNLVVGRISFNVDSLKGIPAGMRIHLLAWKLERIKREYALQEENNKTQKMLIDITELFADAEFIIDPDCGVE